MALKPTIYKFDIALSDLDRDHYESLNLTVARHPSETLERMMARVLAFCFNAREGLVFASGLSDSDEPDLKAETLDGRIELWIDVGEPSVERVRKAFAKTERMLIYSFNSKSDVWWRDARAGLNRLPVATYQFPWEAVVRLAGLVERTMQMSVTISDATAFVAAPIGDCEVPCRRLNVA